jgi:hypothetical protein
MELDNPTLTKNRLTAYELYLQGYMPKEIASKTGLNINTIRAWASANNWKQAREDLQHELQQNYKIKLRQTMMDNRIKTTHDHMVLGEKLEKAVLRVIQDEEGELRNLTASQVQEVCRAGKDATSIRARAVGMSDKVDPLADEVRKGSIIISVGMRARPAAKTQAEGVEIEQDDATIQIAEFEEVEESTIFIPFSA